MDKSLQYCNIIMKRAKGTKIPTVKLPEGYSYVLYSKEDELDWAEIETSVGEFDSYEEALDYFNQEYLPYANELRRHMLFIQDGNQKKIATLTNWWNYTKNRRDPSLNWIGVHKQYQGMGLGKAIVFEGLKRMIEIEGDRDIYLHTQTWSYKAINIYLEAGFDFVKDEVFGDYQNDYEKALAVLEGKIKMHGGKNT